MDHKNKQSFDCNKCEGKFLTKFRVNEHTRRVHDKKMKESCFVCNKEFYDKNGLRSHVKVHDAARITEPTYLPQQMKIELEQKGMVTLQEQAIKNENVCSFCLRIFQHEASKRRHEELHKDERKHKLIVQSRELDGFKVLNSDTTQKTLLLIKEEVMKFRPNQIIKEDMSLEVVQKAQCVTEPLQLNTTDDGFIKNSNPGFNFSCKHCPQCFVSSKSLKNHNCEINSIQTKAQTPTIKKNALLHPQKVVDPVTSQQYHEKDKTENNLGKVNKIQHSEGRIRVKCTTVFKYEKSFKKHILVCEESLQEEIITIRSEENKVKAVIYPFSCIFCNRGLESIEALEDHLRNHKSDIKCQSTDGECRETFYNEKLLWSHMMTVHDIEWQPGMKANVKCDQCEYSNDKLSLEKHMKRHSTQSVCPCLKCGKLFKSQFSLTFHIKKHQGILDYKCIECPKAYVSGSSLMSHNMRIHSSNSFVCDKCGISFKIKCELKIHVTVHTGEKTLKCREGCGKLFRLYGGRRKHEKAHKRMSFISC